VPTFLVVKTVNVVGAAFAGATATLDGTPLQTTTKPGILECPIPAGSARGLVHVTVSGFFDAEQKVTFNLGGSRPTIAFDGLKAINALRVAVASRGSDFNLEVHFVIDVALRNALDAFRAGMSGPYQVNGQGVSAAPQFRMNPAFGGFKPDPARSSDLDGMASAVGVRSGTVGDARVGRPTRNEIVKVTQTLIDAVAQRPHSYDLTTEAGIRKMAFDYGVGIDCAGYVQQAFAASRGASPAALGLKSLMNENLSALPSAQFRRVDVTRARTGDLMVLDPPPGDSVGHTVVIYTHRVKETEDLLVQSYGADARALVEGVTSGPVHLFYVDASWGSGASGDPEGGVQRKPWLFNEVTTHWGWLMHGVAQFRADSPYGHPLKGVFRPTREV
jgi:hypothetical protein